VGGSRATGGDGGATLEVDGDDGLVARGQRPSDEDDGRSHRGVEDSGSHGVEDGGSHALYRPKHKLTQA
jgi:hypothetical protein